jgi:6-phosphogluconolactonase
MSTPPAIRILPGPEELARAAAEEVARRLVVAVTERGRATIALAGGSTPRRLHAHLASEAGSAVPWDRVVVFWGDERHVPPDHADSNYRMALESLLSRVPIPPYHAHRIRGELQDADEAAREYEDVLRAAFGIGPRDVPRFDVVLLGMGADGHTASLFPGTSAVSERSRLVTSTWVERLAAHRVTMTLPVFDAAAAVLFVVSGEDKSATLRDVIQGPSAGERLPSQLVRPHAGELLWLLDRAAARLLRGTALRDADCREC